MDNEMVGTMNADDEDGPKNVEGFTRLVTRPVLESEASSIAGTRGAEEVGRGGDGIVGVGISDGPVGTLAG